LCLAEVLARASALSPPLMVVPSSPAPLERLAQRISRNREVLGLHYPSDSLAGKSLATQTFDIMKSCPTIVRLLNQAAVEWRDFT